MPAGQELGPQATAPPPPVRQQMSAPGKVECSNKPTHRRGAHTQCAGGFSAGRPVATAAQETLVGSCDDPFCPNPSPSDTLSSSPNHLYMVRKLTPPPPFEPLIMASPTIWASRIPLGREGEPELLHRWGQLPSLIQPGEARKMEF